MFKTITVFSLRPDTDPDEFFKYYVQSHALDAVKAGAGKMKKYVTNRVVDVMGGQTEIFGITEIWWENKADHDEYIKRVQTMLAASGKNMAADFVSHGGVIEYKIHVEEKEIPL